MFLTYLDPDRIPNKDLDRRPLNTDLIRNRNSNSIAAGSPRPEVAGADRPSSQLVSPMLTCINVNVGDPHFFNLTILLKLRFVPSSNGTIQ